MVYRHNARAEQLCATTTQSSVLSSRHRGQPAYEVCRLLLHFGCFSLFFSLLTPSCPVALPPKSTNAKEMSSNLGTLPTPFAYNADCSTQMQNAYYVDLDYLLQGPPLALPRCMPDNYGPWADWFYSASSCPPGYTSACQSTQVVATLTDTYVTCCPSVG